MLIAALIFSVFWIVTSRRMGNAWGETLVALLVQLVVLWALAALLPDWVWKTVLLLYLGIPWVGGPWLTWRQRRPIGLNVQPWDPERHAVPQHLRDAVEERAAVLEAAGLARLGTFYAFEGALTTVLHEVLESPDGHEWASVTALESVSGEGTQAEVRTTAVDCLVGTRHADERRLVVHNAENDPLAPVAGVARVHMPSLVDPARLLAFARAYRRVWTDAPTVPVRDGMDVLEFLHRTARRTYEAQAQAGRVRPLPEGGYLLTAWGILRVTLGTLPVVRQLAGLRVRLRERALLRSVGMAAPAPAGRWWFNELDIRGAALLALVLAMLLPVPSLSLAVPVVPDVEPAALLPEQKPYALPQGFSVPADFHGAVRALEQLAGMAAVPLEVEDAYTGQTVRTEGVEVELAADRTDAFLRAAGPLFRARGFLLFRHENTFGHGGAPEFIGLFPRADEGEVMRLVGTNGANYGIDADSVVAWLGRLRARHPFVIFGIAHDAVEGRFLTPLDDAQARQLAEEFHAFCPDVVTQGTETVRALAAEIRKGTLYCWWD